MSETARERERIGYIVDDWGRVFTPNAPCFCLGCGKNYRATLPPSDAPTPIIGPCCRQTEGAKRLQATIDKILSGGYGDGSD